MRLYQAIGVAAGCALAVSSYSQGDDVRSIPCNGRFPLQENSKIVQLLVKHGATDEPATIEQGKIYSVSGFYEFAQHHSRGMDQKVREKTMRMRPVSLLYFDANPPGHSEGDALYATVQIFESSEYSWTYVQCEMASGSKSQKDAMNEAIETTIVAGLEARLNDVKPPSVPREKANRIAMR